MSAGARDRLLGLLVALLGRAPIWMASLLCRALSWIWWVLLPVRREVGLANLGRAFPALLPAERGSLLRRSFHDIALGYVEVLHALRRPARLGEMFSIEGVEHVRARLAEGRGCFLVCGHGGSWDLALLAFSSLLGVKVSIMVRPPRDPWAAAFIERAREAFGVRLLAPRGSKAEIEQALEAGGIVLFPMDQRHDSGIDAPFFGYPARTAPSLAALARRTGLPVLGGWTRRLGTGLHVIRLYPSLETRWTEHRDEDIARNTALFNAFIEQRIRETPHGWLWLHKRWGERTGSPKTGLQG